MAPMDGYLEGGLNKTFWIYTRQSFPFLWMLLKVSSSSMKSTKKKIGIKKAFATVLDLSWYKHRTKMHVRVHGINCGIENIWHWLWFSNYFMCNLLWGRLSCRKSRKSSLEACVEEIYLSLKDFSINEEWNNLDLCSRKLCTDCIQQNVKLL